MWSGRGVASSIFNCETRCAFYHICGARANENWGCIQTTNSLSSQRAINSVAVTANTLAAQRTLYLYFKALRSDLRHVKRKATRQQEFILKSFQHAFPPVHPLAHPSQSAKKGGTNYCGTCIAPFEWWP